MLKVLRVTGNGKANRAIENLTRALSPHHLRSDREPAHSRTPEALVTPTSTTTWESRFLGARGNDGAVGSPMTPDSQVRDERRENPRPHAEVPDHDAERRSRACSQALRATP